MSASRPLPWIARLHPPCFCPVAKENPYKRTTETTFYEPARLSTPPKPLFSLTPLNATTWLRSLLSKVFRCQSARESCRFFYGGLERKSKTFAIVSIIVSTKLTNDTTRAIFFVSIKKFFARYDCCGTINRQVNWS